MKEFIYKKTYTVSMVILAMSLVMMLFIQGVLPFGISASWSEEGLGSSLVLTKPESSVTIGTKVAGTAEMEGKVSTYVVQDFMREGGALQYKVSDTVTMPAQELGRVVIVSVPVIGLWVRMLTSVLGMLTLIGLPFFMLSINALLLIGRTLLPVLRVFENMKRARRNATERKKEKEENERRREAYAYEQVEHQETPTIENELVTVLKPYNMGRRYGV